MTAKSHPGFASTAPPNVIISGTMKTSLPGAVNPQGKIGRKRMLTPVCIMLITALLQTPTAKSATITVTSLADSGPGTLRAALASVTDGDTIDATHVSGTIQLSAELLVSNSIVILGPGATTLAVTSSLFTDIFHISSNITASIHGFSITGNRYGIYSDQATLVVSDCAIINGGGGIFSYGYPGGAALSVSNCNISYNFSSGGINNIEGTLTVNSSTISFNRAVTYGGGINNQSYRTSITATIADSSIRGNRADFRGGGIASLSIGGSAALNIINSDISENLARNLSGESSGGGIYNAGTGGSATLTISSCTITDNVAQPANSSIRGNAFGGGIANYSTNGVASVSVTGSVIRGNLAAVTNGANLKALGGGLYNGGNGSLTLLDSIITGNYATNKGSSGVAGGGGLYNNGSDGGSATFAISNCLISGNFAAVSDYSRNCGGGIFNDGSNGRASLTVINSAIETNSTSSTFLYSCSGGGIVNSVDESLLAGGGDASVTLSNCQVNSNLALNGSGGGIENQAFYGPGANLNVVDCVLDGNVAAFGGGLVNFFGTVSLSGSTLAANAAPTGEGGGISNDGTLTLANCTLNGNSAFGGGAIVNSATLTIANSTLSSNSADFDGGAIWNFGGTLTLLNSTLYGNMARQYFGGGIVNNATLELGSTIFDAGASGLNLTNYQGAVTSLGYNLSSDGANGLLNQQTDLLNTDPMLGPLQDNGGPTLTHGLLPGSPAIDKGKNLSATASDQRGSGFARTVNSLCAADALGGDGTDIGAFETQSSCSPADAVEQLAAAVGSLCPRPQPLQATLDAALASINRNNLTAAVNQLHAFEDKVQARVAPSNAPLAQALVQTAQEIIAALSQ
jgi:hypothetical protein